MNIAERRPKVRKHNNKQAVGFEATPRGNAPAIRLPNVGQHEDATLLPCCSPVGHLICGEHNRPQDSDTPLPRGIQQQEGPPDSDQYRTSVSNPLQYTGQCVRHPLPYPSGSDQGRSTEMQANNKSKQKQRSDH